MFFARVVYGVPELSLALHGLGSVDGGQLGRFWFVHTRARYRAASRTPASISFCLWKIHENSYTPPRTRTSGSIRTTVSSVAVPSSSRHNGCAIRRIAVLPVSLRRKAFISPRSAD